VCVCVCVWCVCVCVCVCVLEAALEDDGSLRLLGTQLDNFKQLSSQYLTIK